MQTDNDSNITALEKEAKRIEEDCIYSSKGHFNAEDSWLKRHYIMGVPATLLSAIAGASLIKSNPDWAAAFALTASLLTGLMTFLKPNERAAVHRKAATKFLALRNQIRFFHEIDLLTTAEVHEHRERLRVLASSRDQLNDESPGIPRRAFEAARRGIEEGEATHRVDA